MHKYSVCCTYMYIYECSVHGYNVHFMHMHISITCGNTILLPLVFLGQDNLSGWDRCHVWIDWLLPLCSWLSHAGAPATATPPLPRSVEQDGVSWSRGVHRCHHSIQLHCYRGQSGGHTCCHGQCLPMEAIRFGHPVKLVSLQDIWGGGSSRWSDKFPSCWWSLIWEYCHLLPWPGCSRLHWECKVSERYMYIYIHMRVWYI